MKVVAKMFLAAALAVTALAAVPNAGTCHILRVGDGDVVTLAEMIEDLRGVRVVFMGELHDNEAHHRAQLRVIRELHAAGVEVAIGLEMFRSIDQPVLDRWTSGGMTEEEFLPLYKRNWSMWPEYREIFHYARKERLPMVGLNIPRELIQQVARNGMTALSQEQLGELPGVRCDVDSRYQEFIRKTLGGHGHNGAKFLHFCEAQMLWDTVMAETLLDHLSDHPDRVVVVLAGSGHAWKFGIPEQIRRRSGVPFRVLLPEVAGRIEPGRIGPAEADYLLLGIEEAPLH